MEVTVRLFAMLRERAGAPELTLELPDGARVRDALASEPLAALADEIPLVMAVNREYADGDRVLDPGDELALIPPVSGGSTAAAPWVRVSAEERMAAIAVEALERHGLCAAAVEHRVGEVPLSEPSVIVAASAPHRGEAFAGAREIIDRVKAEVPIWKKEIEGGDERWASGTQPR